MSAEIIDGKAEAARLRARVAAEVAALTARHGLVPGLAVVLVGEDPASEIYVRNKGRLTREAGMHSEEHRLDAATPEAELLALIGRLNRDPRDPRHPGAAAAAGADRRGAVVSAVAPEKDVDGFHVENVGRLAAGRPAVVPCTPLGCLMLLRDRLGSLAGLEAVVLGRSNIVGRPMAQLLLRRGLHGDDRAFAHARPGRGLRAGGYPGRGGRAAGDGQGRLDQAGGDGDRRRDQSGAGAGGQDDGWSAMSTSPAWRRSRARSRRCRAGSGR